MPYLIDGHNLIPHIAGLSLDMIDDEAALVEILEPMIRKTNKKAVIYFDQAFPGSEPAIRRGQLQIRFVRKPIIVDQAILQDLYALEGEAKNYTVVTSDQMLSHQAKKLGAQVIPSERFLSSLKRKNIRNNEIFQTETDIDYWLRVFGSDS